LRAVPGSSIIEFESQCNSAAPLFKGYEIDHQTGTINLKYANALDARVFVAVEYFANLLLKTDEYFTLDRLINYARFSGFKVDNSLISDIAKEARNRADIKAEFIQGRGQHGGKWQYCSLARWNKDNSPLNFGTKGYQTPDSTWKDS